MKRFLSLLLIFALLCTAMLALASCSPDDQPNDDTNGDITPPDQGKPDEPSKGTIEVVTDPTDPEAGGASDDNYVKENA